MEENHVDAVRDAQMPLPRFCVHIGLYRRERSVSAADPRSVQYCENEEQEPNQHEVRYEILPYRQVKR